MENSEPLPSRRSLRRSAAQEPVDPYRDYLVWVKEGHPSAPEPAVKPASGVRTHSHEDDGPDWYFLR